VAVSLKPSRASTGILVPMEAMEAMEIESDKGALRG
jgi:hypothetical protein